MNPSVSKQPEKKQNNGEEKEKLGDDQLRFCLGYIFFRSLGFLLLGHKRMISFRILVLLRRICQVDCFIVKYNSDPNWLRNLVSKFPKEKQERKKFQVIEQWHEEFSFFWS